MQKSLLERFIGKYNLGGSVESVILESDKGSLKTKFITDDKNAVGFVSTDKLEFDSGEYGVYDTAQLRSILGVLDETVVMKVSRKPDGTPTAITFSDDQTKASYALADKANIPVAPNMKSIPEFDVSVTLDAKFLNTFVKAKGALPDADKFTIIVNKDKSVEVVLGHSDRNTNRIAIKTTADVVQSIDEISFSAGYFRDMLMANKEMKAGTLRVSGKGLALIEFDLEEFSAQYYLVKMS